MTDGPSTRLYKPRSGRADRRWQIGDSRQKTGDTKRGKREEGRGKTDK